MNVTTNDLWSAIRAIREKAPVVHNITNYVVMNSTANALLALGASPVMAHAEEEVEEMVGIASALVINIGTLSPTWVRAMFRAAEAARAKKIPIVLDPVGAGATSYRTKTARELIRAVPPEIIRGNASEIMAILDAGARTKGVDSAASSDSAVAIGRELHTECGAAICISGETDYVIGKTGVVKVRNGHIMMTRVTGLGCTATALCGAFAAVNPDPAAAAAEAMAVMGIAGEIGAARSEGPGSLQLHFLDALYRLSADDIDRYLKIE
ncbi:MAG: hydroxyethylthiazole kinase [Proteobacteria bacterium]|nr:hydroxyethylthiazole kinase [Pseudomonadota bacterium]MBU2226284.1 hydroxyethylthiazole kinase [Pseudomonadota bacterium]MBU2261502.1 hydroxyethylthiazole kinase [Pseudomonadota bacterium]